MKSESLLCIVYKFAVMETVAMVVSILMRMFIPGDAMCAKENADDKENVATEMHSWNELKQLTNL